MTRITKVVAVIAILAISLSFAACRTKDESVLSFSNGKQTYDMKAGTYLCLLMAADSEFRSKVDESYTAEQQTTTAALNYAEQTIKNDDGKEVGQDKWVKAQAMKLAKSYAYTEIEFDRLGLALSTDYTDYISQQCDQYWNDYGYKDTYETNGISYSTYESYSTNTYKQYMVYNYYYGKSDAVLETRETVAKDFAKNKSSKRPDDKKIQQAILDNYVLVDQIVVEYSTTDSTTNETTKLSDTQIKAAKDKLQGYADRINKGETFKAIYNEYNNTADTKEEAATDGSKPKDSLAKVLASADASSSGSADAYYDETKKLKNGVAKVCEIDGTSCALIIRQNILGDSYYINNYSEPAVEVLCYDGFKTDCEKQAELLTLESNTSAFNFYSPSKLVYPTKAAN